MDDRSLLYIINGRLHVVVKGFTVLMCSIVFSSSSSDCCMRSTLQESTSPNSDEKIFTSFKIVTQGRILWSDQGRTNACLVQPLEPCLTELKFGWKMVEWNIQIISDAFKVLILSAILRLWKYMTCKNVEHRYFKVSYWSEFVLCPKSLENQTFSKQHRFSSSWKV